MFQCSPRVEWLETTGGGAFAMGTVGRARTRRYHALLMYAVSPSSGRRVLVPGFDAWLDIAGTQIPLTQQRYSGGSDDTAHAPPIAKFTAQPWPTWTFGAPNAPVREEIFIAQTTGETVIRWLGVPPGAKLFVRPFLTCRDYHALAMRDDTFCMEPEMAQGKLLWRPLEDEPGMAILTNGTYTHEPHWYERFEYESERERGFDYLEDLASPGTISWEITAPSTIPTLILRSVGADAPFPESISDPAAYGADLATAERARRAAMAPGEFAARQFLVRRGDGLSVIAGYPWFTDWGRDTFIAMRGLCTSLGLLDEARAIVETWAGAIENGLLPNCFADDRAPDYCAVDTSLWFIIAANELAQEMRRAKRGNRAFEARVRDATDSILVQFLRGTNFGIRVDEDGLVAIGGHAAHAMTWMDACVNGVPVTPRVGKPVEVQSLWINALEFAKRRLPKFARVLRTAREGFAKRFWNAERGYLADVIDVNGIPGTEDAALRPNQILAIGGAPLAVVPKKIGLKVLETVERELFTPMGLRTLAPSDGAYRPHYAGGPAERDAAYHQGTTWPWLMGAYGEACLRLRGDTPEMRAHVRERCLAPLHAHLAGEGFGHLPEIADGDPPHTPKGCPMQAWSLGEYLRLAKLCGAA